MRRRWCSARLVPERQLLARLPQTLVLGLEPTHVRGRSTAVSSKLLICVDIFSDCPNTASRPMTGRTPDNVRSLGG